MTCHLGFLAGGVAAMGATEGVHAMSSCSGQINAVSLQPLPQPIVMALNLRDTTPANVSLGQAFTNGLQRAGVQVTSQPRA